jgi:hypothetical protein
MPVNAIFSIYGHSLKALAQQFVPPSRNLSRNNSFRPHATSRAANKGSLFCSHCGLTWSFSKCSDFRTSRISLHVSSRNLATQQSRNHAMQQSRNFATQQSRNLLMQLTIVFQNQKNTAMGKPKYTGTLGPMRSFSK